MADNALLLGAIAVGLTITGVGVTYVIDYERRISILESRIDTLTGISVGTGTVTGEEASTDQAVSNEMFTSAIAEGCLRLISSYDEIISAGAIYSTEQERLDALKAQMNALGCTALGKTQ